MIESYLQALPPRALNRFGIHPTEGPMSEKRIWNRENSKNGAFKNYLSRFVSVLQALTTGKVEVEGQVQHATGLLKQFSEIFSEPVSQDGELIMDKFGGLLHLRGVDFDNGLSLMRNEVCSPVNGLLHRINPAENELFDFYIQLSDNPSTHKVLEWETQFGKGFQRGAMGTPGTNVHVVHKRGETTKFLIILVEKSFLQKHILQGSEDEAIAEMIANDEARYLGSFLSPETMDLAKEVFETTPKKISERIELEAKTKILLAQFLESAFERQDLEKVVGEKSKSLANEIREEILEHLDEKPSIAQLCELFGISKITLQKTFQKEFSLSIYQYFQRERMYKAKQLLEQGQSVSEVAGEVGFNNMSHFSNTFKKQFGLNPSELSS